MPATPPAPGRETMKTFTLVAAAFPDSSKSSWSLLGSLLVMVSKFGSRT
jgi:hypothetical protein